MRVRHSSFMAVGLLAGLALSAAQAQRKPVRPTPPSGPVRPPVASPAAPAAVPLPAPPQAAVARVRGDVLDSTTMQPLIGATVQFVASRDPSRVRSATTDSLGFYRIDTIPLGVYLVGVIHPQMDRLGLDGSAMAVQVADTGEVRLSLGLPSAATIIGMRCKDAGADLPPGVFIGTVRRANGAPLESSGRVRAQYLETTAGPGGLTRRFPARFGDLDDLGRFTVCGVPGDATLTTRAYAGADSSGVVELRVPANGLLLRDLVIGQAQRVMLPAPSANERTRTVLRGSGRIRGTVRDTAGRPLVGARVSHGESGVEATSTAGGQFVLENLPGGSRMLDVRAVGFQPQRAIVDVRDSSDVNTTIALDAMAPVVDTVRVSADRLSQIAGFENRRRMGFGSFLDESAISRRNATFIADLLRTTPGLTVVPGGNGRDQVLMRGGSGSGRCVPNVFLNGMNTPVPDGVLDNLVRSSDVRAVEVYPGTGSVPLEFQGRNGCGSIVIWTGARTGGR